jgi:uncharacterized OB-fold protein
MSAKIKHYSGIELEPEDLKSGKVLSKEEEAGFRYSWAAGVAIGRFLSELKKGKIIARKCRKCGRIMVPPRMFCELCFRPTDEWTYVKDTGRVNTFSIAHLATDASRLKTPLLPFVVELDGASREMGFLHLLGEIEPTPEKIKVGMHVQAVWKPEDQRTGSITDIKYFKPIKR